MFPVLNVTPLLSIEVTGKSRNRFNRIEPIESNVNFALKKYVFHAFKMFIGDPKVFFFYSVRDNFKYFWGVPKDTTLNIIKKILYF